jgi:hypothetical protein
MELTLCEEKAEIDGTDGPSVRPMTPVEQQQQEDALWAASSPEVQRNFGRFVAVHRRRVVAVGIDRRAVVEQAVAQEHCPWWELVVELVPRPDFWDTPK